MAWTTPKTDWATGELVAAGDLNAVGENLAALAAPSSADYKTPDDIVKYSNDYVDIDSDNLNFTITTTGRDVLVHFQGVVHRADSSDLTVFFTVDIDGERHGGVSAGIGDYNYPISFTHLITNLSAGPHTFKMQWRGQHNKGVRLKGGAHAWVREI